MKVKVEVGKSYKGKWHWNMWGDSKLFGIDVYSSNNFEYATERGAKRASQLFAKKHNFEIV